MEKTLKDILAAAKKAVAEAKPTDYENLRIKFLGRKAELSTILRQVKDLPAEEKTTLGRLGNEVRQKVTDLIESLKMGESAIPENFDPTLPGISPISGHLHPITQMTIELVELFKGLGYSVAEGPEVELEKYNFDLLNIPDNHPARDEWDTFWIKYKEGDKDNILLRTQTSPVQLRYMQEHQAPLRMVAPGRTFRYEAEDATHSSTFNQFEGLLIDEGISVAHLKATLTFLVEKMLGEGTKIRFRPSFFPFTEPSFELDIERDGKWLELCGAGMVHPQVLKNGGIDEKKFSGFAFGIGIDRLVLLKHQISDIRPLLSADLDFLEQF